MVENVWHLINRFIFGLNDGECADGKSNSLIIAPKLEAYISAPF